jgi:hypothetical protein
VEQTALLAEGEVTVYQAQPESPRGHTIYRGETVSGNGVFSRSFGLLASSGTQLQGPTTFGTMIKTVAVFPVAIPLVAAYVSPLLTSVYVYRAFCVDKKGIGHTMGCHRSVCTTTPCCAVVH